MVATINAMDFVFADYLYPDQLLDFDYIKHEGFIFQIRSIESVDGGFMVTLIDDYDENNDVFIADGTKLEWYVIAD